MPEFNLNDKFVIRFDDSDLDIAEVNLQHDFSFSRGMTIEQALDLSIEKWEALVAFLDSLDKDPQAPLRVRCFGDTCALCKNFALDCEGCPVAESSGRDQCDETPYHNFQASRTMEDSLHWARREVEFLKGLKV